MKIIDIDTQTGVSRIVVNESLQNLEKYVNTDRAIIITDPNVNRIYRSRFPNWEVIEIGTGESSKSLDTIQSIYKKWADLEIDRSCFIVGIGGGIVSDVTGFAASTYMRGLPFGFVSTTLLSQVDAGIGGKNGVNFQGYKNMIGVFNQPDFVICDTETLKTLPHNELVSGFGEVVKHAAIGDLTLFTFLEEHYRDALALDKNIMERVIHDCLIIKAAIVEKDEKEKGERRKLNFGHTLGHAIEKITGILHGEAVSVGMMFAANLSVRRNLISEDEAYRLRRLLISFGLPTETGADKEKIIDAIRKDKKRTGRGIHFVLLKSIGEAVIEEIPIDELEAVIKNDLH